MSQSPITRSHIRANRAARRLIRATLRLVTRGRTDADTANAAMAAVERRKGSR
jgi:hypothetical protein